VSDGFTMIPHAVLEALALDGSLTRAERRVLLVIYRQSWGWNRADTADACGLAGLTRATGLDRRSARRAVESLVARGMVARAKQADPVACKPAAYAPEPDPRGWLDPGGSHAPGGDAAPGATRPPPPGGATPPPPGGATPPHKRKGEKGRERTPPAPHGASAGLQVGSWTGSPAGELWARFAGRDSRGVLRRPSAMQEQVACLILANNDPADIERAAQAVARRGWGWSAFVRCFPGDDCEFDESQLPQDKRRGKEDRGAEQLRRVLGDDVDVDYDVFAEVYGDG